MVISVDPVAGTKLDVDAPVTLTISKGPSPRPVPRDRGAHRDAASATLEAAGFTVISISGPASRIVLTTDPPAGEKYPVGTGVRIIVRTT